MRAVDIGCGAVPGSTTSRLAPIGCVASADARPAARPSGADASATIGQAQGHRGPAGQQHARARVRAADRLVTGGRLPARSRSVDAVRRVASSAHRADSGSGSDRRLPATPSTSRHGCRAGRRGRPAGAGRCLASAVRRATAGVTSAPAGTSTLHAVSRPASSRQRDHAVATDAARGRYWRPTARPRAVGRGAAALAGAAGPDVGSCGRRRSAAAAAAAPRARSFDVPLPVGHQSNSYRCPTHRRLRRSSSHSRVPPVTGDHHRVAAAGADGIHDQQRLAVRRAAVGQQGWTSSSLQPCSVGCLTVAVAVPTTSASCMVA